jgi:hypothetical protein
MVLKKNTGIPHIPQAITSSPNLEELRHVCGNHGAILPGQGRR